MDQARRHDDLDFSAAHWVRIGGETIADALEKAEIHTDGVTYTAVRRADDPEGVVLVYTPDEWDAFIAGVRDGEFRFPSRPVTTDSDR